MFLFIEIIENFLIGLCIGSFLNVVIFRLPNEMSLLRPRSFCPECKNTISWRSNIPLLSFLVQRGKCSYCRTWIGFRYPFVEFSAVGGGGFAGDFGHAVGVRPNFVGGGVAVPEVEVARD